MSLAVVNLSKGLAVGDDGPRQTEAELRELTAGDVLEAAEESEKLVITPDGPSLVQSPTLMGVHTLRRQIKRIGSIPGPIPLSMLSMLPVADLELLQAEAEKLDQAIEAIAGRGRDESPSGGSS